MRYVSIDIETTGLDPLNHDIVEIGAVVDDLSDPKPVEELPRFHAYVLPEPAAGFYSGDPYALSMHPHIFKRIATREEGYTYLEPDEVTADFLDGVRRAGIEGRINVAGKNYAGFDRAFLENNLFGKVSWKDLPIRHRVLDPGPLYWRPGDESVPNLATCLERAGLDPDLVTHNAVDDAIAVVQVLRYALIGGVS